MLREVLINTAAIITEQAEQERDLVVFAEPNYIIGYDISGAPWGIAGAPWGIAGAPANGARLAAAGDLYWNQWAFSGDSGIGLFDGTAPDGRSVEYLGSATCVAIFDTSPFAAPGGYRFEGWLTPTLQLSVSYPYAMPDSNGKTDIRDHGLFVAGLVHAVAPDSHIHLIRVLNDYGQGELHTLVRSLNLFIQGQGGKLENTVINLSLAVRDPGQADLPDEAVQAIVAMAGHLGYPTDQLPIVSMELPMVLVHLLDGVVVAAAGNDSSQVGSPKPAAIPARYGTVLGVEAGDMAGQRACYSNAGGVRAPGGNGGGTDCEPMHNVCNRTNCPYGVISLALHAHKGFAYWVGTSFATPLVSGMAALALQAGTPPVDVAATVENGRVNDIVNVPQTLATPTSSVQD